MQPLNMSVPKDVFALVKDKLFRFLWKNKKDKIKRALVYQDYCPGGLPMVDIVVMGKVLRLAWIRKLHQVHDTHYPLELVREQFRP